VLPRSFPLLITDRHGDVTMPSIVDRLVQDAQAMYRSSTCEPNGTKSNYVDDVEEGELENVNEHLVV